MASSGPDVSSWQHPSGHSIKWAKVKASGQSFVFIKATENTNYTSPWFASDWAGSANAGLYHGAYHFARPNKRPGSAAAQARHFANAIGDQSRGGDLPPVLDLEVTGGLHPKRLIKWTASFLTHVKTYTHRQPMIYSYPYFWLHDMANTHRFTKYPLWVANYASRPMLFGGWTHYTFWQYTSVSHVKGVSGKTDMNVFGGTAAQLKALAHGKPVVFVTPTPTPTPVPLPTVTTSPVPTPTATATEEPVVQQATRLTLHSRTSVGASKSFTIGGVLRAGDAPVAHRLVVIGKRASGTTKWHKLFTVATDGRGQWGFPVKLSKSCDLAAAFFGSPTLVGSFSRVVSVTVSGR